MARARVVMKICGREGVFDRIDRMKNRKDPDAW
jgi:hypothetical protein